MSLELWFRRGALAALPLLLLTAGLVARRPAPPVPAVSASAPLELTLRPPPAVAARGEPLERGAYRAPSLRSPRLTAPPPTTPSASPVAPQRRAPPPRTARELPEALPPPAPSAPPARAAALRRGSTCEDVEARVITASADRDWSFASLARPGEPGAVFVRLGAAAFGRRVQAIEWDRVWLEGGEGRCVASLNAGAREGAALRGAAPTLPLSAPPPWQLPEELSEALGKRSETEAELSPAGVEQLFAAGPALLSGVELSRVSDAEPRGLRLEKIPRDSLLERLGFSAGDVVLSVNGRALSSLEETLGALALLRHAPRWLALVDRDGERLQLELRVQ